MAPRVACDAFRGCSGLSSHAMNRFTRPLEWQPSMLSRRRANDPDFFAPRFEEAGKVGGRMIKAIQEAQKAHGQ